MDLLGKLLGHVLLGNLHNEKDEEGDGFLLFLIYLLGPLKDDLFLKNILLKEFLEDVRHLNRKCEGRKDVIVLPTNLRKKCSLVGLDSFLDSSNQIFLTFRILVGETQKQFGVPKTGSVI